MKHHIVLVTGSGGAGGIGLAAAAELVVATMDYGPLEARIILHELGVTHFPPPPIIPKLRYQDERMYGRSHPRPVNARPHKTYRIKGVQP
jgi:hypothetical protein